MPYRSYLCYGVLQCLWAFSLATVYSCGGFVKSPNVPIDYSKIKVKLLTAEGNLKYEAECNPSNGYYMIPVYNKAAYSIRVFTPEGWFFEPTSVEIKVDGKTDLCTLNEDINFSLAAFAVEGVLRSGDGGGPAGVALTLSDQKGTVIAETKTTANGAYHFRAPPGKYLVSTADGSAECIERGKVPAEVVASPVRVSPDLKISGHLLTVSVLSKKEPLANVAVSLFSANPVKLSYCAGDKSSLVPGGNEKLVCSLITDKSGQVKFPCLPPAKYIVAPKLETDKVQFTFSPKTYDLQMGSAPAKVAFEMRGFSSRGRVLIGETPVKDAEVIVNGKTKAKTDNMGVYSLEELQEEEYLISAKKEHFAFDTVKVRLSATKAEISDVLATKVDICGYVNVEEGNSKVMTVFITNKQTKDPQSARTDESGKFCKMVPPGVYIVSPSSNNGIVMTPKQREVDTSKGPVQNVFFTQFKANLLAKVNCIDQCGKLRLELWNGKELLRFVEGTHEFHFDGISPDSYQLKIVDGGRFCWEKSEIAVTIEQADVSDIVFRQNGHRVNIRASHPAKMSWHLMERKELNGNLDIGSGASTFCVPISGTYSISLDACHKFDKTAYEIVVPQENPLVAVANLFLVTVYVISNKADAKATDFSLYTRSPSGENTIPVSSTTADGKFEFSFYLSSSDAGSEIVLVPQSSTYLFSPTSHVFHFDKECHENVITFKADKGAFLEGAISPPLEGVDIRAPHKTDSNVVLKAVTDGAGHFRMGPVRNLNDFDIIAEKEGYKFEKTDKPGEFLAMKLSQLRIATVDSESGLPLTNVLLSLSGVQSYRSNNLIDDSGKINFVGLQPGEYFIRPILQEYQFMPPTLTINIKEGEIETVTLKGRRFAYSVFGKVTHLAGQPVGSVVVEAVSEQCNQLQEEDITSDKGTYRVRGLHPKCVYRLNLKSESGQRIQSYPTYYDISVIDEDVKDFDFVLTHMEKQLDLVGEVNFVGTQSPPQFRVALLKGDTAIQHTVVNAPSSVFFFDNLPVDGTEYSVRFETVHGYSGPKFDAPEVSFVADKTFKAIALTVKPQRKSSEVEISGGSVFALPFFLFVAFLFFNHQKAFAFAEKAFSRVSSFTVQRRSPTPSDDHPDTLRRRQKARKT